jgi:hypothetical protein
MGHGKSRSALIQIDSAFDVSQLHNPGAADVRLQDDRPCDGTKVRAEACGNCNIFNREDNTTLAKWVGPTSRWKWPTFIGLPVGLLAELASPTALLEVPSQKAWWFQPSSAWSTAKRRKKFNEHK